MTKYGYANPPSKTMAEAYEGLESGNGDLMHDLRPLLLDMIRRIQMLEATVDGLSSPGKKEAGG